MQLTVANIMNNAMQYPELLLIGAVVGFILAKLHSRRRGMGGLGGGF
ncbi:MAG: hypothetical protein ABEJ87_05910 [Candidatus Nanohalobium sp.]